MSLKQYLPAPIYASSEDEDFNDAEAIDSVKNYLEKLDNRIPPYGQRVNWVPQSLNDYGDGGAFPEIAIVQYPLNLGKSEKVLSNAVPVQVDSKGKIRYDVLLKRDAKDKKMVHYEYNDMIPMSMKSDADMQDLSKPTDEEINKITEETKKALDLEVLSKVEASLPSRAPKTNNDSKFIRYTPAQSGENFNSGAKQRLIRVTEIQRDPMSPPRFSINGKVPAAPGSPPAPVLHSPPRKVTVEEQEAWKIPPCISSWKNPRGYVIPLDKRLATDGRGLLDPHINDKFAKLAEALYIADRKAREAVEMRAQMEKRLLQKEKEIQEENLRELAKQAREERKKHEKRSRMDEDEQDRDMLRKERQKDRERDRRIARAGADKRAQHERQKDRDISEKIALGIPAAQVPSEALYDQRLFNQTQGLDTGFAGGEDEIYNVYDEPWRKHDAKRSVYKAAANVDTEIYGEELENEIKAKKFVNDKGILGSLETTGTRTGPVKFEKNPTIVQEDPLQLDSFFTEAKTGKRRLDRKDEDSRKRRK